MAGRIRAWLPGLFRTGFLGCRKLLQGLVHAGDPLKTVAVAAVAGAAVGVAVSFVNRAKKSAAKAAHETTTLPDLEK